MELVLMNFQVLQGEEALELVRICASGISKCVSYF